MFGRNILRRIYGLCIDFNIGKWRIYHTEQLENLFQKPDFIGEITRIILMQDWHRYSKERGLHFLRRLLKKICLGIDRQVYLVYYDLRWKDRIKKYVKVVEYIMERNCRIQRKFSVNLLTEMVLNVETAKKKKKQKKKKKKNISMYVNLTYLCKYLIKIIIYHIYIIVLQHISISILNYIKKSYVIILHSSYVKLCFYYHYYQKGCDQYLVSCSTRSFYFFKILTIFHIIYLQFYGE